MMYLVHTEYFLLPKVK